MHYTERAAPPPLDGLVRCFWFLRGEVGHGSPEPVVADGRFEIVLHLADPFLRRLTDGSVERQASALLAGQMTAPLYLQSTGVVDVVGIRFRTAAAASFLQVPLAEITDRVEALADCDRRLAAALTTAAEGTSGADARVASLSAILVRAWRASPDPLTSRAIHAFDQSRAPTVAQLAGNLGVSLRTLERRLAVATGLAPAPLRRVLRFRRAFAMLQQGANGSFGRIAAASGYYDQAHLIREFRRFAGLSPRQFFGGVSDLARSFIGEHDR